MMIVEYIIEKVIFLNPVYSVWNQIGGKLIVGNLEIDHATFKIGSERRIVDHPFVLVC